ncbi:MAG: response regulator [Burkholderiales bacterium]|nr:response regulator [Burkholderiales bacterium]
MGREINRILYIEDDPDIRAVGVMSLEAVGGFTVVACASGAEAIAAAPSAAADLVLLDMMMPGMDGHATLRALRALPETADTPAIFMTARVQAEEIAQHKAVGGLDVIPKPFDPMALPDQIRRICAGA